MKYKFLFFDIDDTLWNCKANSITSLLEVFAHFDISEIHSGNICSFYQHYEDILADLLKQFQAGRLNKEELRIQRIKKSLETFNVKKLHLAGEISDAFIKTLPTKTETFPNAHQTLGYLKEKGYQLHIISNGFDALQKEKVHHAQLLPFFNKIITSERARFSKPDRRIFEFALKETGALCSESIMIGDDFKNDVVGAWNFGMDQVYIQNAHSTPKNLKPTFTIDSLDQLSQIF